MTIGRVGRCGSSARPISRPSWATTPTSRWSARVAARSTPVVRSTLAERVSASGSVPVAPSRLDALTSDQSGSTGDRDLHHCLLALVSAYPAGRCSMISIVAADGVIRERLPDETLLVFLSDTHIGGSSGGDIFDSGAELTMLLEDLHHYEGPVELVLAGDFLDVLRMEDVGGGDPVAATLAGPNTGSCSPRCGRLPAPRGTEWSTWSATTTPSSVEPPNPGDAPGGRAGRRGRAVVRASRPLLARDPHLRHSISRDLGVRVDRHRRGSRP